MKYVKYAKAVLRHKWFVFVECAKRGLIWRGLMHDISKFRPSEFFPYANYFYGDRTEKTSKAFDSAWLKHQHRNKHHWQHWVLQEDTGETKLQEMPKQYRLEMICDWVGASKAYGSDIVAWYAQSRPARKLNPKTLVQVEKELAQIDPALF